MDRCIDKRWSVTFYNLCYFSISRDKKDIVISAKPMTSELSDVSNRYTVSTICTKTLAYVHTHLNIYIYIYTCIII